jgi:outer membrane protein assembly factor BamB
MRKLTALTATLILATTTLAGDWPQWNGPNRDGHAKENGLLKAWPKGGPKLLWTYKDAGSGFTAGAVVGGTVYTMGCRGEDEYIIAIDNKGNQKWATKIGRVFDFKGNQWSRGPNGTPAVDGGLVYGVGSQGILICVDAATGAEKWRSDMPNALTAQVDPIGGGVPNYGWGFCGSPLVDGDHVIVTPGGPKGLLAALDKKSGVLKWQSKDVTEQATDSSPIVAEIGGVRQYIAMTPKGLVGIDAKTGALLWSYKNKFAYKDRACVTPLVDKDNVFMTATTGGCDLVKVANGKATQVYANRVMGNFHGGVVLLDGTIFGSYEMRSWRGLDFMTGKQLFDTTDIPIGSVTVADGMLYVLGQDTNTVHLVEATKLGLTEKGQFPLPAISALRKPSAKAWTHPVVSDGKLYIREQDMIFCYDVKK